jgi:hypothetical protein
MNKVIHDNKEKCKKYVIPTNGWLEPIKPLLDKNNISLNTKGLLILSNMIDNGEVVVKISKNIDKTLKSYTFDRIKSDEKNSRSYYKGGKYYNLYIEDSIWNNLTFVNKFWKISFNEYLFPEYTLEYDK